MMKNFFLIIIILLFTSLFTPFITRPTFAATAMVEYICELGITFYRMGKFDDALQEFNKALMLEPKNAIAQKYVNKIFQKERKKVVPEAKAVAPKQAPQKLQRKLTKEETIEQAFRKLAKEEEFLEKLKKEKAKYEVAGVKITGETQLSLGWNSQDVIWKRANFDMNERNWRMLSDAAYNQQFNTYDYRIYDSLDMDLDTQNKEGFNFHTNITVDPWSFTGKGPKTTITSTFGDTAEIEMKYWSNTGYTMNETVYTGLKGNSFSLPEVKLKNNETDPLTAKGGFTPADTFNIPEMKIQRQFQPVRELWFDYNQEPLNLRVFPIAYQDQAFTSDDPLQITNHHIWWEDSMWLRRYVPGIHNSGASPEDFTKGYWDSSLNFLSRNSNGTYLTALRGLSFSIQPQEETSFSYSVASPKHLWQDYEQVDNVASAARLKHYFMDNLLVGATLAGRSGLNLEQGSHADNKNYVGGIDIGYEISDGIKANAEVLGSKSLYDLTNDQYRTEARGFAYYFSLIGRYPFESIMDEKYGYDGIKLEKGGKFLLKSRFFFSHMDDGFESSLSSFRNTRDDTFWSRHISFRRPFEYYYAGLKYPGLRWDDIDTIRIGNGIDYGRDAFGLRIETIYRDCFENLFDVRNVHNVNGKFIENVARDELSVKIMDRLTVKFLGIYHRLPKTKGGIDPFIFYSRTGDFLDNTTIQDGVNPSLKTGSIGLEYAFFDWLSLNGVYERTNDSTEAYDNFPRGVLNDSNLSHIYYEYDKKYRAENPWLYEQALFPLPPYSFFNVWKSGLRISPIDQMDIYLDYTRNEFESAGQIADTMNHVGFEFTYMPTKKLGLLLKYTYSRWKDLQRLRAGITEPRGHHNFFSEFRYLMSEEEEFILQYGEGNISPIGNITFDPYGGALTTIDTQHIVRAYYRRKF